MILAMLHVFAVSLYLYATIKQWQSSATDHNKNVERAGFLDDVSIAIKQGSKVEDFKKPESNTFPAENRDLGVECPYHTTICNSLCMLLVHAAINIISMIAVVTIFKRSARNSEQQQSSQINNDKSLAGVSMAAIEESCKEPKSELVL